MKRRVEKQEVLEDDLLQLVKAKPGHIRARDRTIYPCSHMFRHRLDMDMKSDVEVLVTLSIATSRETNLGTLDEFG